MSPEISERSFEDAIECALLQFGPNACAGEANDLTGWLEAGASGHDSRLLFRLHRAELNELGRYSAFLNEGTDLE